MDSEDVPSSFNAGMMPKIYDYYYEDSHDGLPSSLSMTENSDIVSDSSGVCTSTSDSTVGVHSAIEDDVSNFAIGMLVVCLKQYATSMPGHLNINPGEIIESNLLNFALPFHLINNYLSVIGLTEEGLLNGTFKGRTGLFPAQCVQEIRLRNPKAVKDSLVAPPKPSHPVESRYGTTPRIRKYAK